MLKFLKRLIVTKATMQPVDLAGLPLKKIYNIEDANALNVAVKCLQEGKVIALPTDTVYGLACDADNEKAVQKLYEIKGRDFHKPVAIYVNNLKDFRRYGEAKHLSEALLESLLPGPCTIVVERSKHWAGFLNPHTKLVGIRNTNFEFLQKLSNLYDGKPLALTSANRSNHKSSLKIKEFRELWPKLGGIFDAGPIGLTEEQRAGSTVIDLSNPGYYKIVREGIAFKQTLNIVQSFNIKPWRINVDI